MRARHVPILAALLACGGCCPPPPIVLHHVAGSVFSLAPVPRPRASRARLSDNTPASAPSERARYAALMARLSRLRTRTRATAAAVAVIRDGAVVFRGGVPDGTRTARARFVSASMSKMITAATVLALVDRGKLALHRPIRGVLRELADQPLGAVTPHQLLTHTAAVADLGGCPPAGSPRTRSHLAALLRPRLLAPPGLFFNYSNGGYAVLAAVVERVTAQRFADAATRLVLHPAGMNGARYLRRGEAPPADLVRGVLPSGKPESIDYWRCALWHGYGGLVATVDDYARFFALLLRGGAPVLSARSAALMQRAHVTMDGDRRSYGYGLMRAMTRAGQTLIFHGGGTPAVTTLGIVAPETRRGVVIFINAMLPLGPALGRSLPAVLGVSAQRRPFHPPRPSIDILEALTGYYVAPAPLGRFVISRRGHTLRFQPLLSARQAVPSRLTGRFVRVGGRQYFVSRIGVALRRVKPR